MLDRLKGFFSSSIFPILLVNFIGILGYSVVVPILIFIVQDFGGNGFIYGVLGATYPFFQFMGAPILGRLSDNIGRRKVLIISQIGTFCAWALFLVAFTLPEIKLWEQNSEITGEYLMTIPLLVIFLARMLDGFTGGNVSVANAYMSDISDDDTRNSNFGKMGASTSLGFVIGPAFAGLLSATTLGEVLPLLIAAAISLVAVFVIKFRLKESVPCTVDTSDISFKNFRKVFQMEVKDCFVDGEDTYEFEEKANWSRMLKIDGVPVLFSVYFLTFLAFSLFYASLPIYASTQLEWSAVSLGVFLAYFSFVMVIVQGPVLTRLGRRFESFELVIGGSSVLAVGFIALSQGNLLLMYLSATVMAFGNGIMWASFLSLLSKAGKKSQQGAIQGYGSSTGSIANMLGLVLGGILFQSIGIVVFAIAGGIFIIIAFLIFFRGGTRRVISSTSAS
jgi:MFS family permease